MGSANSGDVLTRYTNDLPTTRPGWVDVAWRKPGYTPWSDGARENYPVLTAEQARAAIAFAGDRPLVLDVEEAPEKDRVAALNAEVHLIRRADEAAGKPRRLLIPYGVFPQTVREWRLSIDVFRLAGCAPVDLYLANSPHRAQFDRYHGSQNGRRVQIFFDAVANLRKVDADIPCVAWLHDSYVFADRDAGDATATLPFVGGDWTAPRPLYDDDVRLLSGVLKAAGVDCIYWNEPGAAWDERFEGL